MGTQKCFKKIFIIILSKYIYFLTYVNRAADVRSFDETTVQAVTKSMHQLFDMQTLSNTNEVCNTKQDDLTLMFGTLRRFKAKNH